MLASVPCQKAFFFFHKFLICLVFEKNLSLERFVVRNGRGQALQRLFRMGKVMQTWCGFVGMLGEQQGEGCGVGGADPSPMTAY